MFFKGYLFLFPVNVYLPACIYLCMYMPATLGGQKRVSDTFELELWAGKLPVVGSSSSFDLEMPPPLRLW